MRYPYALTQTFYVVVSLSKHPNGKTTYPDLLRSGQFQFVHEGVWALWRCWVTVASFHDDTESFDKFDREVLKKNLVSNDTKFLKVNKKNVRGKNAKMSTNVKGRDWTYDVKSNVVKRDPNGYPKKWST